MTLVTLHDGFSVSESVCTSMAEIKTYKYPAAKGSVLENNFIRDGL